MLRFSFKIQHKNCSETALSIKFPKHFIIVVDIQSKNKKEKQYLYYIKGNEQQFNNIIIFLQKNKSYKTTFSHYLIYQVEISYTLFIFFVYMVTIGLQLLLQQRQVRNVDIDKINLYILCAEELPYKQVKKGKQRTLYLGKFPFNQESDALIAAAHACTLDDTVKELAKNKDVLRLGWYVNFVSFDIVQIGGNAFFGYGPAILYRVPNKVLENFA